MEKKQYTEEVKLPDIGIYTKRGLKRAIKSKVLQRSLLSKNLFGEAGHPIDKSLTTQCQVNSLNLAVLITKLKVKGKRIIATYEFANTNVGRELEEVKKSSDGVSPILSMRAKYDIAYKKRLTLKGVVTKRYVTSLNIIAFDTVINM